MAGRHPHADDLVRAYVDGGLSVSEVAARVGVDQRNARLALESERVQLRTAEEQKKIRDARPCGRCGVSKQDPPPRPGYRTRRCGACGRTREAAPPPDLPLGVCPRCDPDVGPQPITRRGLCREHTQAWREDTRVPIKWGGSDRS